MDPKDIIYNLWQGSDAHEKGSWEKFWKDYGSYFPEFDFRGIDDINIDLGFNLKKKYREGMENIKGLGRNIGRSGFKTGARRDSMNTAGKLMQLESSTMRRSAISAIDDLKKSWENQVLSISRDLANRGVFTGKEKEEEYEEPWYAVLTPWNDRSFDPFS